MTSELKLLLVSDYSVFGGGVYVYLEALVKAFKNIGGVDVRLLTWNRQSSSAACEARHQDDWTDRLDGVYYVGPHDGIVIHEAIVSSDIVGIQCSWNTQPLSMLACHVAHASGVPSVATVHTSSNSKGVCAGATAQNKTLVDALRRVSAIVAVSTDVCVALRRELEARRIVVIGNGSRYVGTARCDQKRTRIGPVQRIGYVGRPTKAKGWADMLRLVRCPEFEGLSFALNTVVRHKVENLPNNATLISNLSKDEMRQLYEAIDLLILPYIACDGMPLVALEALSLNTPIVGYDALGLGPVLRKAEQYLAPVGEFASLRSLVRDIVSALHPLLCPQCTVRGWREVAEDYLKLFEGILHG